MSWWWIGNIWKYTQNRNRKKKTTNCLQIAVNNKVFKDCGLSITIECILKSVDFLDVTFDLVKDIWKPYCKPNNKALYMNRHSNHPRNISKQLPKSIKNVYLNLHKKLMYSTNQLKSTVMHYMKVTLKKHYNL